MMIQSVLGPISPEQLGATLMHEHITNADWSLRAAFGRSYYDPDMILELAVHQFLTLKEYGISSIVDGTPINLGRDVSLIREVSQRTGLHFICSCGFYAQEFLGMLMRDSEEIYELMLKECETGVAETGIRPGMIKCAVDADGFTDYTLRLLTAAAQVAAQTGLPVFNHSYTALQTGPRTLDLLEEYGVQPARVIIGHSGDTNDIVYLESLLQRGCYIGMDRFAGFGSLNSLENRVDTIVKLWRRGWLNKMFLSHDLAVYYGFGGFFDTINNPRNTQPRNDYTYIHQMVLPLLRQSGMTQKELDILLIENPKNFFSGCAD